MSSRNWNQSTASLKSRLQQALASGRPTWTRPWIAPTAWTSGETVVIGDVRKTSIGQWYVCSNAGTCGATEPTHLSSSSVSDGGAFWMHLGGPSWDPDDDAAKPTITLNGTSTPSGMTTLDTWANRSLFTLNGCYAEQYSSSNIRLRTFAQKSGTITSGGGSVAFWSDAPALSFQSIANDVGMRIYVDGRPVTMGPIYAYNGTTSIFTVDWGIRKNRLWEVVYGRGNSYLLSMRITTADQVWPYKPPVALTGGFIGDSYLQGTGYGPLLLGHTLSAQVGRVIGIDNMWRFGTAGTGLINPNTGGGTFNTYVERLPELLAKNPDVIFVYGSTNDSGYSQADIQAAALTFLDTIRATSKAPVFWFGPSSLNITNLSNVDNGIASAVAQRPNKNIFYQSMMTATPPWFTGSHNNSAFSWTSNVAQYIAPDNLHPVDKAIMYLAQRMAASYANDMLPLVA